jgi:hypothetical protein
MPGKLTRTEGHAADRDAGRDDPAGASTPGKATLTSTIRRKPAGSSPDAGHPAVERAVDSNGAGAAVPDDVRAPVERMTGGDLSTARVHSGPTAETAAEALDARAFTVGRDIFLGAGEAATDRALLAHEATHVVQQAGAPAGPQAKRLEVAHDDDASEEAADRVADAVSSGAADGEPAAISLSSLGRRIARKPKNTVTTPDELPGPVPPGSVAAPAGEPHLDAEGNVIEQHAGHWHPTAAPKSIGFPIKGGYKPQLLPINPNAAYRALYAKCQAIMAEQLTYSIALQGDMKYWFSKVYYFVTKNELKALDAGTYQYPHMKMQEVVLFHATYKQNLDNWMSGNKDKVEAQWKEAFSTADSYNDGAWFETRAQEIGNSMLPAMQAHIRIDLPRAIAAAYVTHYAGIPGVSLADFKADFDGMGPVFDRAQADLLPEIKRDTGVLDPGRYKWIQDIVFPFKFSVGMERQHTWEKAGMLTKHMRGGSTNSAAYREMRSTMTAAHPNSASDTFEVDGTDVGKKVDWMNQPGLKPDARAPDDVYEPAPPPPPFPEKLFFKRNRPDRGENLEKAIRDDQDLAPYQALAEWTRKVRGAVIWFEGKASAEGPAYNNHNLANLRAFMLKYFMIKVGADWDNNTAIDVGLGDAGTTPDPQFRHVAVRIHNRGTGRQQHHAVNPNLPSEAT